MNGFSTRAAQKIVAVDMATAKIYESRPSALLVYEP